MEAGYTITRARPEHLPLLPDIEREAAFLFDSWDVPQTVRADTTPRAEFAAAQRTGLLWVVLSPQQQPVGFALLEHEGSGLHLEEIDVHPLHGRRGIGRALIETVCAWARGQGIWEITLTTYREIPWNAPWYARMGFVALNASELTAALDERVADEAARGLDPGRRVVMRKTLDSA